MSLKRALWSIALVLSLCTGAFVAVDASAQTGTPPAVAKSTAARPALPSSAASRAPRTVQQPPVKGMVWVNPSTKVFHREGDRYYGATKNGKFMTEAEAISAGYHEAKSAKKAAKTSQK